MIPPQENSCASVPDGVPENFSKFVPCIKTCRNMTRNLILTGIVLIMTSCNSINPFFGDWDTPYSLPPFGEIHETDYLRAVKFGIHQQASEVDAIIARDAEPTFENTIAAYEHSGRLLDRVTLVLFNLAESDATPALQKVVDRVIPLLTEHTDNIFMNPYFFERVKTVYDNRNSSGLTDEQVRLTEKLYRQFIANGVALDASGQARMREINREIAALEQAFGNNLLAETNAFTLLLTDSSEVSGLPESVLHSAAAEAEAAGISAHDAAKLKGLDDRDIAPGGPWLFTLQNQSYVPFMTYSTNRDLREKMFRAYSSRGNNGNERDNKDIILKIIGLRIEKAQMLGYDTPADFILADKMAKTPAAVDRFLDRIFRAGVAKAKEEAADMQEIMDGDALAGLLPADSTSVIRPWDWAYYAERVRMDRFAVDETAVKPYFKMENVRQGVFETARRLYGVNFEKLEDVPVYHPDVEAFRVTDSDSTFLGILLTDYYPRTTKRGGAWMSNFRNQEISESGEDIRPIIVNVGNFTKPAAGKPSLLTLDETATMFHEFGHALHGLLTRCTYKDMSGTNVARDFVELPSQLNENWAFQPEVLATYATHYETGETIPDSLVTKIRRAGKFNYGFMTTELAAASILDMRWHELTSIYVPSDSPFASGTPAPEGAKPAFLKINGKLTPVGTSSDLRLIDPLKFEESMMKDAGLIDEIIPRYRTTYFNHIFKSGYNAGYYSYLWAEVLDKDAFELFLKKGIFDKRTSMSYRRNILEKGDSEDPMTLYRRFRGAEPDAGALLRSRGL